MENVGEEREVKRGVKLIDNSPILTEHRLISHIPVVKFTNRHGLVRLVQPRDTLG